jgi:hypothetical protein
LYSLYQRRDGETRWTRISDSSYKKDIAVRVFQDRLYAGALGGYQDSTGKTLQLALRTIKIIPPSAR